jgi:hypothetical protein
LYARIGIGIGAYSASVGFVETAVDCSRQIRREHSHYRSLCRARFGQSQS